MKNIQSSLCTAIISLVLCVSFAARATDIQVSPNGYSGLGVVPSASTLGVGTALVSFDPTLPGAKNTLGYNTQIGFGLYLSSKEMKSNQSNFLFTRK